MLKEIALAFFGVSIGLALSLCAIVRYVYTPYARDSSPDYST